MSTKRLYHLLAILMVVVLAISACAPAATQARCNGCASRNRARSDGTSSD